ncbi:MAG TPA: cytochrome c biogenesis protein CcdA [Aggregatilinea sp.]|uniref:cytochrome c biogenesis protein/redoxin n=1 Tax=Aggregatilinea sp. TaxID=2806333 RepID=UPI002C2B76BB|nr:cytochrome c biogenesis protein/redoxin [Aggregatilinea sp.]HML21057.1 cytochrome c biogenesis protein CcdA [Aggregatilinea sp.]
MESSNVTIGLAFLAGLISFVSPCVLPLVPAYVGYMGGRVTRQAQDYNARPSLDQRFGTLVHGLFFVLGFTIFFVLFGLLTTAAVSSLTALGVTEGDVRDGLARVGGAAIILFGLHVSGLLLRILGTLQARAARLDRNPYANLISALIIVAFIGITWWLFVESWFLTLVVVLVLIQFFHEALKADTPGQFWSRIVERLQVTLYTDTRRLDQPKSQATYLNSMFMGVVFSAGWTPCIGPIYGSVLITAATGGLDSILKAGPLMLAYSLGLGIPFLLTALALNQSQGIFRRLQRNTRTIEAVSGVFLMLVGVAVFTGQLQRLSTVGSKSGSFAELSVNMENCAVGVVQGDVAPGSFFSCIGSGTKESFYVAASRDVTGVDPDDAAAPDAANMDNAGDNSAADDVPTGLAIGQRAPDFTTQTVDGDTVSLSDYRGKVVLLNFWATWCGPCRAEFPYFQSLYALHEPDFVVLGVDYQESADTITDFTDDLGITFPLLLDEDGAINGDVYGARIQGYPTSFLIDQNGVIVAYYVGEMNMTQLNQDLSDTLTS